MPRKGHAISAGLCAGLMIRPRGRFLSEASHFACLYARRSHHAGSDEACGILGQSMQATTWSHGWTFLSIPFLAYHRRGTISGLSRHDVVHVDSMPGPTDGATKLFCVAAPGLGWSSRCVILLSSYLPPIVSPKSLPRQLPICHSKLRTEDIKVHFLQPVQPELCRYCRHEDAKSPLHFL